MKMKNHYAELLVDIDEFLAYPLGCVAFDMLMTSFVLALQLVIVEDVLALTEVVQESCSWLLQYSSSESESDDEESDCRIQKTKKKTLSPGHAREVDKKAN
ncbi:unnamed protein product, partial [Brassica napus]